MTQKPLLFEFIRLVVSREIRPTVKTLRPSAGNHCRPLGLLTPNILGNTIRHFSEDQASWNLNRIDSSTRRPFSLYSKNPFDSRCSWPFEGGQCSVPRAPASPASELSSEQRILNGPASPQRIKSLAPPLKRLHLQSVGFLSRIPVPRRK